MSAHSVVGSGDGPSRDPKPEHSRLLPMQQGAAASHVLPQGMSHEVLKSSLQAAHGKAAVGTRTIAPAPGPAVVAQSVPQPGSLSLTRLPTGPIGSHALVTKLSHGIVGSPIDGQGSAGQPAPGPQISVSATTIGTPAAVHTQPGLTIQPSSVQMASLIRGGPIANTQQIAQLISQQQQQQQQHPAVATSGQHQTTQPGHVPGQQLVHTFAPHVPRGAVAASALAQPKAGSATTAMLRASQPGAVQLTSGSAVAPHVGAVAAATGLHGAVQPRALIPVRPTNPVTPPATRPASPAVTSVLHNQSDPHRAVHPSQPSTSAGTTVQITIQQPRNVHEMQPRPTMLSQQQLPKQLVGSQPILQPAQLAQTQKVIMTQAASSPVMHSGVTPTTLSAAKLIAQSQPYNLSQPVGRSQKIVMTHPGGGATAFTQPSANPSSKSIVASSLTTKQKIIMTTQPVSTAALNTQTVSSHGALNLTPQHIRPQKVLMSQSAGGTLHNITTLQKPGGTISLGPASGTITMGTNLTTPTTVSVPSIPIAKVPPQRQIATHQVADIQRDNVSVVGGQATLTQQQQQQAASLFLQQQQQQHRGSPVTAVSSSSADTRPGAPLERVPAAPAYAHPAAASFPAAAATAVNPGSSDLNAYYQHAVYQNLMYNPQLAAAQAQAFTSLAGGTTIRPSGIVATPQTPNLAATLQAAAHVAVTSAQGVRLNPMMVTVDTRHPSLPVAQYAAAADGRGAHAHSTEGAHALYTASQLHPGQQSPANPNASPRPSILRKRTSDGSLAAVRKNLLPAVSDVAASATDLSSRAPFSPNRPSMPLDPSRENSQSSTDTATSTESTSQSGVVAPEVRVKTEDGVENGPSMSGILGGTPGVDESPRKRPRKQLLNATEDLREADSTDDEVNQINSRAEIKRELEKINAIKQNDEYIDEEGVRWVAQRARPNISLMNHYHCTWKARNNHFLRYQDVKPKDERRPTVNELSNQKGVLTKASGWKMYHLATQLEEMIDNEKDVLRRLTATQEAISPKHDTKHDSVDGDVSMIHELTQGNIQRCQLVADQLDEAKNSMLKILDHKTRILEIVNKHHSKRPVKKKERT